MLVLYVEEGRQIVHTLNLFDPKEADKAPAPLIYGDPFGQGVVKPLTPEQIEELRRTNVPHEDRDYDVPEGMSLREGSMGVIPAYE